MTFVVDPESEVELGYFNGVYHVHNSKGGMMPSLFDKSEYVTPEGSASPYEPAEFYRSAKNAEVDVPEAWVVGALRYVHACSDKRSGGFGDHSL